MSDEALLHEVMRSNEDAFTELYYRYYNALVSLSKQLVKSTDVAQEIAQEALIKLWEKRESFTRENSNPRSLLFKIVRKPIFKLLTG